MLRPIEIIILFYSRTRNGTNINFSAVFISMLNSGFLTYKVLSHYFNSATEMFQWKQGVINQKQRMIFPRRFKRKKTQRSKTNQTKPPMGSSFFCLPDNLFCFQDIFWAIFISHSSSGVSVLFHLPQKLYYVTPRNGCWLERENRKMRDCKHCLSPQRYGGKNARWWESLSLEFQRGIKGQT